MQVDSPSPTPPAQSPYATLDDYAQRLQVHRNTVRAWIRKGMPHLKAGHTVRVIVAQADLWLQSGGANASARRTRTKRQPASG